MCREIIAAVIAACALTPPVGWAREQPTAPLKTTFPIQRNVVVGERSAERPRPELFASTEGSAAKLEEIAPLVLLRFERAYPLPADARPAAVAVDPRGWLYVADCGKNRLLRLTAEGDSLAEVGGYGWGREQFDRPADVCAANGLDVYVCDYNNNRLERYDKDLNYLASLTGHELHQPWAFGLPVSVAQGEHGDVFLAERENRRIIRFDALGDPVDSFGDIESGDGQLSEPTRLEIDGANRVVVVDSVAHRVSVFDFFGNYLGSYGQASLRKPVGLACLGDSLVVVVDLESGLVAFYRGRLATTTVLSNAPRRPVDVAAHGTCLFVLDAAEPQILRYGVDVRQTP